MTKKILAAVAFVFFISMNLSAQQTQPIIEPHADEMNDMSVGQEEAPQEEEIVAENPQTEIFTMVEQMPQFPGGEAAMYKFLSDSIIYPEVAREANIEGKVFIQFIVTETGEVTQVRVLKGFYAPLDNEALRVIRLMPKWIPGKQNGRTVSVYFTLPIVFSLK